MYVEVEKEEFLQPNLLHLHKKYKRLYFILL